jgi:hypothetical protein
MTAAEVRAYLEAQGWKLDSENEYRAIVFVESEGSSEAYIVRTTRRLRLSWKDNSFDGPLPSTPADLAALLRCLGAPVKEAPIGWPYLGTVIAVVDAGLRRDPNMVASYAASLARLLAMEGKSGAAAELSRVLGYGIKDVPERRKGDHPEMIPCKLCGGAFDAGEIYCSKCEYEATTLTEWRILMGRRRTDWGGK